MALLGAAIDCAMNLLSGLCGCQFGLAAQYHFYVAGVQFSRASMLAIATGQNGFEAWDEESASLHGNRPVN